jgi:hypothetical protein
VKREERGWDEKREAFRVASFEFQGSKNLTAEFFQKVGTRDSRGNQADPMLEAIVGSVKKIAGIIGVIMK